MTVLIAGGGIAGLTLGLTLHQIGVPFRIYETTHNIRPLGVGINLQPNAVRELFDLGLETQLETIGVKTSQISFHSKYGLKIWEEPRGQRAGYKWPQYSLHRGKLQVMLYETLLDRAGPDCVITNARVTGFENAPDHASLTLANGDRPVGDLVIAADGIHSALRAQIAPDEGDPIWNGRVLWRATTLAPQFFGRAAMVMIGHDDLRVVAYPISKPDPETGLVTLNWIAEKKFDPTQDWAKDDWNRAADINDFLPDFKDWTFDWIDAPALIQGADQVFEYPMVDRLPLDQWTYGRVTLMGDAAHPTYPVGSNGASQAIIDARIIGAEMLKHGVTSNALKAYEAQTRPVTTGIFHANRGSGPDAIMQWVEDRCGGQFTNINDIIPHADLAAHSEKYKSLAGFSIDQLNAKAALIAPNARLNS